MKHISERESELPPAIIGQLLEIAAEHKEIISLGPGEPDFPMSPDLVRYTRKIADQVNHYSPPIGRTALREALLKKLKKENKIDVEIDNVTVTTGSQEGMMLSMMCTMDAAEQLLVPNPGFMGYIPCAELVDVTPVPYPLTESNDFEIVPDDIRRLVTTKTAGLLINTPANPTGSVITKKTMEELADIIIEKDLYVISDEAYEHVIYDTKHTSIASLNGMNDHAISLFTFSKSYAMCGFRLGYCVAPADVIKAIAKSHVYTTLTSPTISQMLAVKALTTQAYTRKMVKEYRRRRDMIVKRLNMMGLSTRTPQGAFYAFANIQEFEKDSRKFAKAALEKAKVAVVPGSEFGSFGEGYIRCSYATKYSLIAKAMDRLEKFVKNYK